MNDHEPDPEFLHHMSWLVRTARRRQERFAAPVAPATMGRPRLVLGRLQAAALMLFALACGATAGVASERLQRSPLTRLRAERAALRLQTAIADHERGRAEHERLAMLHARQLVSEAELDASADRLAELQLERDRLRLEREEVELSGRDPDDSLAAPLVDGRDFVAERLELRERRSRERALRLEREQQRLKQLAGLQVVSAADVDRAVAARRSEELVLRTILERLSIRSAFLAGDVPLDRVEPLARIAQLRHRLELARFDEGRARARLRDVALEVLLTHPEIGGDVERGRRRLEELLASDERPRELRARSAALDHAWRALEDVERELALVRTELELAHAALSDGLTPAELERLLVLFGHDQR